MMHAESNSADGTLRGYAPECLREPWLRAVGGRGVQQLRVPWAIGFVDQTLRFLVALMLPEGGETAAVKKVWKDPARASLGSWGYAAKELAARLLRQPDAVARPVAEALLEPDGKTFRPLLAAISAVVDTRNALAHEPGLPSLSSDAAQEAYERVFGPALGTIAEGLGFLRSLHVHTLQESHKGLKLLTFLGPETIERPVGVAVGVRPGEPLLIAEDGRVVELGPLLCVQPRDDRPRPMLLHTWADEPSFLGRAGADTPPSRAWLEVWPARPALPLAAPSHQPALGAAIRESTHRLRGVLVADRFRVEAFIAQGGSAQVHRALDLLTNEPVALKVLHHPLQASASHRERLRREVEVLQRLRHPNVVRLVAFQEQSDHGPLIAMQLGQGVDLEQLFSAQRPSLAALVPLVLQLLDTLAEVHAAGVWHRDIKPANLLLDGDRLLLLDFGIARDTTQAGMTGTLDRLGTRAFAAPEQLQGGEVGPAADLFAVGRLVTWLVTGKATPEGLGDLPPSLQAWVRRATRTSPDERFPSALAMGADLRRRALAGLAEGPPLGPGDTLRGLYRVVEQPIQADDGLWEVPVHELGSGQQHRLRFLPANAPGAAGLSKALRRPDPQRLVALLGLDGLVAGVYRDLPTPAVVGRPAAATAAEDAAPAAGARPAGGREAPAASVLGMRADDPPEPGRNPLAFNILLAEALLVGRLRPTLDLAGWFMRLEAPPARTADGAPRWLHTLAQEARRDRHGAGVADVLDRAAGVAARDPEAAERLIFDLLVDLVADGAVEGPGLRFDGGQPLLLVDAHPERGARQIRRGGRVVPLPPAWAASAAVDWRRAALEALPAVEQVATEQTFEVGYDARRRPVALVGYEEQHRGPASTRPFLLRAGGFITARGIPLVGLTDGATWRWLKRTGVRSYAEVDPSAFASAPRR